MKEDRPKSGVVEQIVWPEKPPLKDSELWAKNVDFVKILCRIGEVIDWVDGEEGKDTCTHMPHRYDVRGIEVEFLPHWVFYSVGGVNLHKVPTSEQDVFNAIKAVKTLEELGRDIIRVR